MPQGIVRLPTLGAILACIPLVAALLWAVSSWAGPGPRTIQEGAAAPVWPLGLDGSLSRVLISTHGQYYDLEDTSAFAHSGIDIGACAYEPVFAAEDGTVVYVWTVAADADKTSQELIVSRGPDLSRGLRYLHLASVEVKPGEVVKRDQLVGSVAPWDDPVGCDHLHLQAASCSKAGEVWPTGYAGDDGNPLLLFESHSDSQPPVVTPMPSKLGESLDLLLYEDGTSSEVVAPKIGQPMDVVVCVHDRFPGDESPECDAPEADASAPSELLAPYGFQLRVSWLGEAEPSTPYADPASESGPGIELGGPVGPLLETSLAKHVYHETSVGTFTARELRFVVTNDPTTGSGAWTPAKAGYYRLEVVVQDAAHHLVTVPARTVSVKTP